MIKHNCTRYVSSLSSKHFFIFENIKKYIKKIKRIVYFLTVAFILLILFDVLSN